MESTLNNSVNTESTSVEPAACAMIRRLMAIPPAWVNVAFVAKRLNQCLNAAAQALPMLRPRISAVVEQFAKLADHAVKPDATYIQGLWGLHTSYPVWTTFANHEFDNDSATLALGYLVAAALLAGEPIAVAPVVELKRATKQFDSKEIDEASFSKIVSDLSAKALKRLARIQIALDQRTPPGRISQRVQVLSVLAARMGYKFGSGDASFISQKQLSEFDLLSAIKQLSSKAELGCGDSLAKLLSFCIGLPWDLSLEVMITCAEQPPGEVVWIDARAGLIVADLTEALQHLGRQTHAAHLETSLVLRRPLPSKLASMLLDAVTTNRGVTKIGHLVTAKQTSRKKMKLLGLHRSGSISQFLASAPSAATKAVGQRHLAAICTLGFGLITKSDLHYITFESTEICKACELFYSAVGLGPAQAMQPTRVTYFGSCRTPEEGWIKTTFSTEAENLIKTRCGRRYTLASLVAHHNRYARYVCLLLQLVSGARHHKAANFKASGWHPEATFGLHKDKPCSKNQGLVHLPIPTTLAEQITLWLVHLDCLARRLNKLNPVGTDRTLAWIERINQGEDVDLLFALSASGVARTLWSEEVFTDDLAHMNKDFGRHFWPNKLIERGLSFDDAQAFLRHAVRGQEAAVLGEPGWFALQRLAHAIEVSLVQLDIRALPGLAKGAS
jgi:hypothetical protein